MSEIQDKARSIVSDIDKLRALIKSVPLFSLTVADLASIQSAEYQMDLLMIWMREGIPWK